MRVLIQRVTQAAVSVEQQIVAEIAHGLLLFVAFGKRDTEEVLEPMQQRIAALRIFPDERGRFNRSLLDARGEILAVSQFTLYADTSRGRRPGFEDALSPQLARVLYDKFLECLRDSGASKVAAGVFGAHMAVALVNDGPVTLLLDSDA